MKLTRGKLIETLRRKNEGWTTYQARKIAGITVRRVNQIWKQYQESGQVPGLIRPGRPAKPIELWERKLVKDAYHKYMVSASTLEKCIDKDYGQHIPHNKIHRIMVDSGLVKMTTKKYKRKKWVRYERRHSLQAVHLDWCYDPVQSKWVLPVIDNASRMLLSLLEVKNATTDASIQAIQQALKHGPIRECITDRGTQFTKNMGKSRFTDFLRERGIKHILCRVNHPQTNGKSEIFNKLYRRHRHSFPDKEGFVKWYNEIRPHLSLRFDVLETPAQSFEREKRKEEEKVKNEKTIEIIEGK